MLKADSSGSSDGDSSSEDSAAARQRLDKGVRKIDPEEPDVYVDGMYGPLFRRFQRLRDGTELTHDSARKALFHERDVRWRFSDYWTVTGFLIFNFVLQLSVSWKVYGITESTFGTYTESLFDSTCFNIDASHMEDYYNLLLTSEEKQSLAGAIDCLPPAVFLSLRPQRLDSNNDGFWSTEEAGNLQKKFAGVTHLSGDFVHVLTSMIEYDSKQGFTESQNGRLDMGFFDRNQDLLKLCAAGDPNICGNLEHSGELQNMSDQEHPVDRVAACYGNMTIECPQIFGQFFRFIHHQTVDLCGPAQFTFDEAGVNVVSYAKVRHYTASSDAVVSTTFMGFLFMLLLVWTMVMLQELRATFEFFMVTWNMKTTHDDNPEFAKLSKDGKLKVERIPISHKIYSLVFIVLGRTIVNVVVYIVGVHFLTGTDTLIDLILNSTALAFLSQIAEIIHKAFFGSLYTRFVTDRCEAMEIPLECDATNAPPFVLLSIVICGVTLWLYHVYTRHHGFSDAAAATECLCHLVGESCLARMLIED